MAGGTGTQRARFLFAVAADARPPPLGFVAQLTDQDGPVEGTQTRLGSCLATKGASP